MSAQRTIRLDEPKTSACRASDFSKLLASRREQGGTASGLAVAGLAAHNEVGLAAERVDAVGVVLRDAGGQHRRGRSLRDGVAGRGDERVETGAVDGDHEAGIGAELPGAHRERRDERAAEVGPAGSQGAVEQEHRVDRTHLGVDRDRLGAARRGGDKSRSRSARSGEADGLDARIGDEGDAELGPRPEQQREGACGQPRVGDGLGDGASDELGGAGMRVMGLDDDGAAGGQRRCGVAAGDGERQREVACTEDGDRAQRDEALANVGAWQRGSVGTRRIDAGAVPAALAKHLGEQSQLAGGTADLAGDARLGEAGFGDGAGDDVVTDGFEVGCDGFEEPGALLGRRRPVDSEGFGGRCACGVDVGPIAVGVGRFEVLPGAGVEAVDRSAGSANGRAGDEHLSRQARGVGDRCCHARQRYESISMLVQDRFGPE